MKTLILYLLGLLKRGKFSIIPPLNLVINLAQFLRRHGGNLLLCQIMAFVEPCKSAFIAITFQGSLGFDFIAMKSQDNIFPLKGLESDAVGFQACHWYLIA